MATQKITRAKKGAPKAKPIKKTKTPAVSRRSTRVVEPKVSKQATFKKKPAVERRGRKPLTIATPVVAVQTPSQSDPKNFFSRILAWFFA